MGDVRLAGPRRWPSWASTARSNARPTGSRSAPGCSARIAAKRFDAERLEARGRRRLGDGGGDRLSRPATRAVLRVRRRGRGRGGGRRGRRARCGASPWAPSGAWRPATWCGTESLPCGRKDSSGLVRASRSPARRSAASASSRSFQGVGPVGPMIDRSWPLPASRTMSPGRARSKAASMAARRSAMTSRSWPRRRPAASAPRAIASRIASRSSPRGSSSVTTTSRQRSPAIRPISGRLAVSRSPAEPKTAISPPPRAAATGARTSSTAWSDAGLWAKSTMTPNGWPRSTRSIRPGTTATEARPARTAAGIEPDRLAEGDDGERVVDVEPAGEPELDRAPRPTAPRRRSAAAGRPPRPGSRGRRRRGPCRRSGPGRRPPG